MIPATIRIGAFGYTVSDDPDEVNRVRVERAMDLLGHSDHRQLHIVIDPTQAEGCKRDTVLHEALHGIIAQGGIARALDIDPAGEEKLITLVTPAVLALLRDNPDLVTYLTAVE